MSVKDIKFPYDTAEYEEIPCSFCDGTDVEVLCRKDRNGLPVRTVICRDCGLIFISPRMTKKWYEKYYEKEYRDQMARFKGVDRTKSYTDEYQFAQAAKRGELFLERIGSYAHRGLTVDVGSSAGGILYAFRERLGVPVLGVEPSQEEAQFANRKGIRTVVSMFEDLKEEIPLAANILSFRSLNHMLLPRAFFEWAHAHLERNGRLLLEVMNFIGTFGEYKSLHQAVQIDHVYMFTKEVLAHALSNLGFTTLVVEDSDELHCYVVAEKTGPCRPVRARMRSPENYRVIRAAIARMPDSYLLYFFKYGWRREWRILKMKVKRFFQML
jgi:SAM-dependent methyltransferase